MVEILLGAQCLLGHGDPLLMLQLLVWGGGLLGSALAQRMPLLFLVENRTSFEASRVDSLHWFLSPSRV